MPGRSLGAEFRARVDALGQETAVEGHPQRVAASTPPDRHTTKVDLLAAASEILGDVRRLRELVAMPPDGPRVRPAHEAVDGPQGSPAAHRAASEPLPS